MRPLSDILEIVDRSIFKAINDLAVIEGYAVDRSVPGITNDETAWKAAEDLIKADKGFVIDIFGYSNNHDTQFKKVPRIVYNRQNLIPGSLGNSPSNEYELNASDKFDKLIPQNQTSDLLFKIGLHAANEEQDRILHAIVAAAIAHKDYIPFYNDDTERFLILQYTHLNSPDLKKGTIDNYYMYRAVDLYEGSVIIDTTDAIDKIRTIDVDLNGEDLIDLSST